MRQSIKIIFLALLVFLTVFLIIKKSYSDQDIVKKYHVIMTRPQLYNENEDEKQIFSKRTLYYAGYIYKENDGLKYVPVKGLEKENGYLLSPDRIKRYLENVMKKNTDDEEPIDFMLNNFESFSVRFIDDKVGQKYFDNGWSKSQGDELYKALIKL
ncbi:hypothetical protein LJC18_03880 [Lachnospiraceae bacterium OttesenSCG-928-E19]|nr:hypothetical protein [Lachnospiraceae bacterium OttesenSCG-928-E19]